MIDRRTFTFFTAATVGAACIPGAAVAAETKLETGDDGLHIQPWFLQSFLDLREDHEEAATAGKHYAIIFEQKGCPYCREMHAVNFRKDRIVDFVQTHFNILQLNLWGSRPVTDFDDEELEERALARKWAVNFTPTIVFFGTEAPEGKSGRELEVARMPGYFKPFHFLSMFEFVDREAYKHQGFQRFLQDKVAEMEKRGKKPDMW